MPPPKRLPRRSGRSSKGKAPAQADAAYGAGARSTVPVPVPVPVSVSVPVSFPTSTSIPEVPTAVEDVWMEQDDGGETPRKPKPKPGKRPVVRSPTSDNPPSRRQRVNSEGDSLAVQPDPVRFPHHFSRLWTYDIGQGACSLCQKHGVECVPQPSSKKGAFACAFCTARKARCSPVPAWAQANLDAEKARKRPTVGR
jgi:hypothetical protein